MRTYCKHENVEFKGEIHHVHDGVIEVLVHKEDDWYEYEERYIESRYTSFYYRCTDCGAWFSLSPNQHEQNKSESEFRWSDWEVTEWSVPKSLKEQP